jgi:hypothetical protein
MGKRTKRGLINRIYAGQRSSSKTRNHPMPNYNSGELREWAMSQDVFHVLYDEWVKSGYESKQTPSCDRLDDYKPYTLDNLRITTWDENRSRSHSDMMNGINNKRSKSVAQYDLDGVLIQEFHSQLQAMRVTGVRQGDISACCRGVQKKASGFVWKFL